MLDYNENGDGDEVEDDENDDFNDVPNQALRGSRKSEHVLKR